VIPVLDPAQAAALDAATQARGTSADVLMERAGRAVARGAVDLIGGVYGRRAVVVCGRGNNGGDGLVAARHLARWGVRVAVSWVEEPGELREPAAGNLGRLAEVGLTATVATPATLARELARADVAIDAIFGTGFRGVPEGPWAAAIAELNAGPAPAVAIDLPSGVNGATGAVEGLAVACDLTVTFGAPKIGAVLLPGAEFAGAVRVVDIGFPADLIETDVFLTEPTDVAAAVPVRAPDTHKRAAGVVLVVAGSRDMTGAARLIAEAAGRAGAGLVIAAVPIGILPAVQAGVTEAVFVGLPETADGGIAQAAVDPVLAALADANALAIGPGLTAQTETARFVREVVAACPVPAVIDADALNAFAGRAEDLADRKAAAVLTPHAGEFGRLSGVSAAALAGDRVTHARALAAEADAVALLKGSRTVIAHPDGSVRINPTGSAVLATAGSGDVLTGIIGGLLARGTEPLEAAAAGAYLHGLAGMLAGQRSGDGTLAGDLLPRIPDAVARVGEA